MSNSSLISAYVTGIVTLVRVFVGRYLSLVIAYVAVLVTFIRIFVRRNLSPVIAYVALFVAGVGILMLYRTHRIAHVAFLVAGIGILMLYRTNVRTFITFSVTGICIFVSETFAACSTAYLAGLGFSTRCRLVAVRNGTLVAAYVTARIAGV